MSIVNSWASQLNILASLTDAVSESIRILIKDKQVRQYPQLAGQPAFQLQDEQVHEARNKVASFVGQLVDPEINEDVVGRISSLPDDLLDEYRSMLNENDEARHRFEQLYQVLQANKPVRDVDKSALDDLVITLDNSRREIFQQLRQSGG